MQIDHDIFWNWITNKLGEENCIQAGVEVCINSPFVPEYNPDKSYKCWCNPYKGVYHCWKTDTSGTLYKLVMELEGCNYLDAQDILGEDHLLYKMEEKITSFFANKQSKQKPIEELKLPPATFKISSLSSENRLRILAEKYLTNRKIPIEGLYVCGSGKYAMRIIIPYYGNKGQLIYFNGRDFTGKAKLRYRGPEKSLGTGKNEVIWMKEWPAEGSIIYLTEGEFDAMSLCEAGFNGAAMGGKNFSDKQLQLVKPYSIILCFDLDNSGSEALNKTITFMKKYQFVRGTNKVGFIKPAEGNKDWNEMLVKYGKEVIHGYIIRHRTWI